MVTTYHPSLKDLHKILTSHIPKLLDNPRLAKEFSEPPIVSFRRPRNIKDLVVRTRLDNPLPNAGFSTCSNARCLLCKHTQNSETFKSSTTGKSYKILGQFSCNTNNCIYLITCKLCGKQYVGETTNTRLRINNHRSTIKTKRVTEPVGEHFNIEGHVWQDMQVVIIDHNSTWTDSQRKSKEKSWMHRLKSCRPDGMNKLNDFLCMNPG